MSYAEALCIFQANQGLPIIIWLVLSFYGLVLVVFVLFAGVQYRTSVLYSSFFDVSGFGLYPRQNA